MLDLELRKHNSKDVCKGGSDLKRKFNLITSEIFRKLSVVYHKLPESWISKVLSHVGIYDRANNRPKLAMLAANVGPMIDRGLDDNCGPILACYIGPKIAPDDRPRSTARVKPTIFQIYNYIINDNKILNLAYY